MLKVLLILYFIPSNLVSAAPWRDPSFVIEDTAVCAPEISPQGEILAQSYTTTCFSGRDKMLDTLGSTDGAEVFKIDTTPWTQTIKTDLAVCDCLKRKPHIASILASSPVRAPSTTETYNPQLNKSRSINNSIEIVNNEIMSELNGMIFQASLLSPGTTDRAQLLSEFNMSQLTDKVNKQVERANQQIQSLADASVKKLDVGLLPELLNSDRELEEGHCITKRDYQKWKQVPTNPAFYRGMEKLQVFNRNDWNSENIKEQLRTLQKSFNRPGVGTLPLDHPDRQKEAELKSRLLFLNNNQLYKNLFDSKSDTPKIAQAQRLLFDKIKKAFTIQGCDSSDNYLECPASFASSDRQLNLTNEAGKIFSDPSIRAEVVEVGRKRLSDILDGAPGRVTEFEGRPEFFIKGSTEELYSCKGQNLSGDALMNCLTRFGDYCRELEKVEGFTDGVERRISDNTYDMLKVDNDALFEAEYESICKKPRFAVSSPSGAIVGKTFAEFKAEYCSVSSNPPSECRPPESRLGLVSKFLNAYPATDEQEYNWDSESQTTPVDAMARLRLMEKIQDNPMNRAFREFFACQDYTCQTATQTDDEIHVIARTRRGQLQADAVSASDTVRAVSGSPMSLRTRAKEFDRMIGESVATRDASSRSSSSTNAQSSGFSGQTYTPRDIAVASTPLIIPSSVPAFQESRALASLPASDIVRIRDEIQAGADISVPQVPVGQTSDSLASLRSQISDGLGKLQTREEKVSALNSRLAELERERERVAAREQKETPSEEAPDVRRSSASSNGFTAAPSSLPIAPAASVPTFGSGAQVFSVPAPSRSPAGGALGARSSSGESMRVKYEKASENQTESGGIIVGRALEAEGQPIDPQVLAQARDAGAIEITPEAWSGIASGQNVKASELLIERARALPGSVVRFMVTAPGNRRMNVVVYKGTGQYLVQPVVPRASLQGLQSVLPQS